MNKLVQVMVSASVLALASSNAIAGDGAMLSVEGAVEFEWDNTFDADDPAAEMSDLYNTTELGISLDFGNGFSAASVFVFEPVLDPVDDRTLEDHGLFLENVFLQYSADRFTLYGGKINPVFGTAWDMTPGLYGVDIAEEYELAEMIGVGGDFNMTAFGSWEHVVSGAVFYADTSNLSDSWFTERGQTTLADGGPGNTEGLDSYAFAIDGTGLPSMPGLAYHVGYRSLAKGVGDLNDERAVVFGLSRDFELNDDMSVSTIFEFAKLSNTHGGTEDSTFFTTGGSLVCGPWSYSLAYSNFTEDAPAAPGGELETFQYQLSVGYEFENGVALEVGYKMLSEHDEESRTFGVLFVKEFEWPHH